VVDSVVPSESVDERLDGDRLAIGADLEEIDLKTCLTS